MVAELSLRIRNQCLLAMVLIMSEKETGKELF